ncbi:MAG: signal peptidase I [Nitrospirae bacterium]|nr:signal peptidase I [Nitrospirota bacterium]
MAKGKSKFREYVEAIATALILALVIRAVVIQAFKIPSGSMIPTLSIGDHILVTKFTYGVKIPFTDERIFMTRQPRRGDIIVFSFPGNAPECKSISARLKLVWADKNPVSFFKADCRDFIKRVIGIGGDRIDINNKTVYVNGAPLTEPYAYFVDGNRPATGPFTVPRGKFFVMGDNRDQSFDSRFWGYVDMSEIKGKALIIYWSWDKDGEFIKKVRWGRLGSLVK